MSTLQTNRLVRRCSYLHPHCWRYVLPVRGVVVRIRRLEPHSSDAYSQTRRLLRMVAPCPPAFGVSVAPRATSWALCREEWATGAGV
jgi:hypothetical protein